MAVAAFLFALQQGYVAQVRTYVQLTMDELRKCSWPSWDELKGSTVVVAISLAILGGFTIGVDFVFYHLLRFIT